MIVKFVISLKFKNVLEIFIPCGLEVQCNSNNNHISVNNNTTFTIVKGDKIPKFFKYFGIFYLMWRSNKTQQQ